MGAHVKSFGQIMAGSCAGHAQPSFVKRGLQGGVHLTPNRNPDYDSGDANG